MPPYRDTLTGGTHDVNPQFITGKITYNGATGAWSAVALPTSRLPQTGRAQVLEVLKVYVMSPTSDNGGQSPLNFIGLAFSTKQPSVATGSAVEDPSVFLYHYERLEVGYNGMTATAAFDTARQLTASIGGTYVYDLTDGAGHGVLVGSDNVYVSALASGAYSRSTVFKIMYRWKDVSLAEYIGMVAAGN